MLTLSLLINTKLKSRNIFHWKKLQKTTLNLVNIAYIKKYQLFLWKFICNGFDLLTLIWFSIQKFKVVWSYPTVSKCRACLMCCIVFIVIGFRCSSFEFNVIGLIILFSPDILSRAQFIRRSNARLSNDFTYFRMLKFAYATLK